MFYFDGLVQGWKLAQASVSWSIRAGVPALTLGSIDCLVMMNLATVQKEAWLMTLHVLKEACACPDIPNIGSIYMGKWCGGFLLSGWFK